MASQYRVTLAGPHVSVDRPVSESVALQVLGVLAGESAAASAAPAGQGTQSGSARTTVSTHGLRAYLDTHQATEIVRKIAAIGAYLATQGQENFTSKELLNGFDAAKEAAPKNISRDIHNTQRTGWIATRRGQRGTYFVTAKGLSAVEAGFATSAGKQKRRPRRRSVVKKKV